jgi:hypothetical protein
MAMENQTVGFAIYSRLELAKCDATSQIEMGGNCVTKTVKAVLTLRKGEVTDEIWDRAIEMDPEHVAREWLARH